MTTSPGPRFGFGRNWQHFARNLHEEQIQAAIESLRSSLGVSDFSNLRILDAGCGSGLFSLAACRLGAAEVIAFDYDLNSVSCAVDLNQRFGPYPNWTTIPGDVLDTTFLSNLGKFDIVYSWGVLHHTGDMWNALGNVSSLVKPAGALFISIYNDQGWISRIWKLIKRVYVCCPKIIQFLMALTWFTVVIFVRILSGLWYKKSPLVWFKGAGRGMNLWYDTVDWVGGYPYETASLETLKSFLEKKCFFINKILANRGSGCNQLVALNKNHGS